MDKTRRRIEILAAVLPLTICSGIPVVVVVGVWLDAIKPETAWIGPVIGGCIYALVRLALALWQGADATPLPILESVTRQLPIPRQPRDGCAFDHCDGAPAHQAVWASKDGLREIQLCKQHATELAGDPRLTLDPK